MPWAPVYATLQQGRDYLRVPAGDTADDLFLQALLTAASRAVDEACHRQFGSAPGTRHYPMSAAAPTLDGSGWQVEVDDVPDPASASVQVGGATVAVTWWPPNAVADGRPHTAVRLAAAPAADIAVTADPFGWAATPAQASNAVLLQTARWWVRRESPYGIAGSPTEGSELRLLSRLDPDVSTMLVGLARARRTG